MTMTMRQLAVWLWVAVLALLLRPEALAIVDYDINSPVTLCNAVTTTGRCANLDVRGYVTVLLVLTSVSGTTTITPNGSWDGGTTWTSFDCYSLSGVQIVSPYTSAAAFRCNVA